MQSSHTTLKNLSTLSPTEQKRLEKILKTIRENNKAEISKLKAELSVDPLELLYAFSEKSPEVHSLLENDKDLNQRWSERLKKIMGYPSHPIISFDKKMKVSLFSQMKGAVLMRELNTFIDEGGDLSRNDNMLHILKKACDLGMHQALVMRLNYYSNVINNLNSKEEADTYIQYQFHDVHKLSHLYWALGCVDSAMLLLNIVDHYYQSPVFKSDVNRFFVSAAGTSAQFSWSTKYDDKNRPYPIALLELAVENLYIATLLSKVPESDLITNEITHGEGLFSGLEDHIKNLDDVQNFITNKLDALGVPLSGTFCDEAHDHAIKTIHQQMPQFKP